MSVYSEILSLALLGKQSFHIQFVILVEKSFHILKETNYRSGLNIFFSPKMSFCGILRIKKCLSNHWIRSKCNDM